MNLTWAIGGALVGLVAGAGLRRPVYRLSVRADEPERELCPYCGERLRLLRGCCGRRLGAPVLPELVTATVLALVAARFAGQVDAVVFAFLGVLGVALATIDIAVERLPDRLTLPAYPVVAVLLGVTALVHGDFSALLRAFLGCVALAGGYLLLALLRPGQLGAGDVKLAGVLGLALGWLGWPTLALGAALAFVLSAVVSLALLAARRITLRDAICFGPFMLAGALVAVLL